MKRFFSAFLPFFWHTGGFGLLVLGILDSSFLFAPLGNDILVVGMTARSHSVYKMLYYAGMSSIGSVLGCLLVDLVMRRAGEKGLEKYLSGRRLDYVKSKVNKDAAWAVAIATIAPPPFPFTPVIMAAAALQYPRKRLLAVVGAVRMVRFTGLGVLALFFGQRILKWAEGEIAQDFFIALIAVFMVGSALSVYGWIKRSRKRSEGESGSQEEPEPERRRA